MFKAKALPAARTHGKSSHKLTNQHLTQMSGDQLIAVCLSDRYRELRDDLFKAMYLPLREAIPQLVSTSERLHGEQQGPLAVFVVTQPSVQAALTAVAKLDRRVTTLRVIEALRIYTALHNGLLSEVLMQITNVPVPLDDLSGRPFDLVRSGQSGLLSTCSGPLYRITIRP